MSTIKNNCLYIILVYILLIGGVSNAFSQTYSVFNLYQSSARMIREAERDGDDEKIREAIRILQEIIKVSPNYYEALKELSLAYYMLNEDESSFYYLEKGLTLQRKDNSLQRLQVILLLRNDQLQEAFRVLQDLKTQEGETLEVLIVELIYYVVLGEDLNIQRIVASIEKRYGSNEIYLLFYNTVLAIVNNERSVAHDNAIETIQANYRENVWTQWLLGNYFAVSDNNERLSSIAGKLKTKKVSFLVDYAYQVEFDMAMNEDDTAQAIAVSHTYLEKYPKQHVAWTNLFLAYYTQGNYAYAERALARALTIVPQMDLLWFMYDTVLQENLSQMSQVAQVRIDSLYQQGIQALGRGTITIARDYFRRILYIDPLNFESRRSIIEISELEGNYKEAIQELETLIHNGYQEENIDYLLDSYYSQLPENDFIDAEINSLEGLNRVEKIWEISLGNIVLEDGSRDEYFYRKLIEYFASRSRVIDWKVQNENDNDGYEVNIDFISQGEKGIVAHVELYEKSNNSLIFTFNKSEANIQNLNAFIIRIVDEIEKFMPQIYQIISFNNITGNIIIDNGYRGLEAGQSYNVYQNISSLTFHLLPRGNREGYSVSVESPGRIIIDEVLESYAVGTLERSNANDNTNQNERLKFLDLENTLSANDVIIKPSTGVDFSLGNITIQSIRNNQKRDKIKNLFLHLALIDFFIDENFEGE